ncbi:MAG TPA: hypothetical protein DF383_05770, partial [Deltaproteobacteria bacterium]|nr:hypothetical protein [Deltaproteobacteria bacterium]
NAIRDFLKESKKPNAHWLKEFNQKPNANIKKLENLIKEGKQIPESEVRKIINAIKGCLEENQKPTKPN